MTYQADNAIQSATDDTAATVKNLDHSFSGIVSAQNASEKFVIAIKDLYQELKSAPTGRADIRQ